MKKKIILISFFAISMMQVNAQLFKNLLNTAKSAAKESVSSAVEQGKSAASSAVSSATSSTGSALSDVFNGLIGTSTVSESSIVGTWTYSQPAVAFESENILAKAGSTVVANKVQSKLGSVFQQYGIKSGLMTFTFNADNSFTASVAGKTVNGVYKLNGSNISFYRKNSTVVLASANAKVSGSNLQLTFKADKLLTFAQYIADKSSSLNVSSNVKTTMSAISTLSKNYSGMQLGFQFAKK